MNLAPLVAAQLLPTSRWELREDLALKTRLEAQGINPELGVTGGYRVHYSASRS